MVNKDLHSVYNVCDAALLAHVGGIVDRIVKTHRFDAQSPDEIAAAVHAAITDLAEHIPVEEIAAQVKLRRREWAALSGEWNDE